MNTARTQLALVVILLTVAGLGLTLYKHMTLGFPLLPGRHSPVWTLEAQINFDAEDGPAQAILTLPAAQDGAIVLDEFFSSPGYGINVKKQGSQRQAVWSIRQAEERQTLFYRIQLRLEPEHLTKAADEPASDKPDTPVLTEPYSTAAKTLLATIREQSSDNESFTGTLLQELNSVDPDQNTNMLLGNLTSRSDKVQLILDLLHQEGIHARMVRGLQLEDGRRKQPIVDMVEIWNGWHWILFNPDTAASGAPDNFFLWQRGGKSLLDVMGGSHSRVEFSMISQPIPTKQLALEEAASGISMVDFSIYSLPLEEQNAFKTILLVPIGILVVLVMRVLVGLRTSGTFMPVLIAVAFLQTRWLPGLVIFITVVTVGLWLRFILSRLNMLLVARLGSVVIMVVGIMVTMSILSWKLGITQALTVTFFPMIILAWTIERMSILWEEEGPRDVFIEGFGSLLVASLSYLLMTNRHVEYLTFNFPELLMLVLAATLLLGQYTGYRLLELKRFRSLIGKPLQHPAEY
ncbi:inactive transglutaminase family protein [Endozoicomonadaceae bacterium StTr2]